MRAEGCGGFVLYPVGVGKQGKEGDLMQIRFTKSEREREEGVLEVGRN
jgi:hypothetical protein